MDLSWEPAPSKGCLSQVPLRGDDFQNDACAFTSSLGPSWKMSTKFLVPMTVDPRRLIQPHEGGPQDAREGPLMPCRLLPPPG